MNQGNDIVNPVADSNPADQAAHGLTRRGFLKGSAAVAASLMIGVHLPGRANAQTAAASDAALSPNAFVRINQDSTVTVIVKHIEFGQGPVTGLSTLVAEELDADWDQMRAELAPANTEKYANKLFGLQGTGGSTAMASSYEPMRQAGAAARAVLVQAAANRWGVDASEITVSKGTISHSTSNQSASFGELVAEASQLEVPAEPKLKSPDQFNLIGTQVRKLDTRDKTNGKQNFTLDLYPDNMVVATILHPPQFGAALASLDDSKARQVKGVIDVKAVPAGVAVYAEDTYAALKGRKALDVKWDAGKAEKRSTIQMEQEYSQAAAKPGLDARKEGDVESALESADQIIEAEYFFPFLAHAPMETLDAVVQFRDGKVTAWMGTQIQTLDRGALAGVFGVDQSNVTLYTEYAGGSFGRRAQPGGDFASEAAQVTKALGSDRPVKLMWTRENDIQGGRYRPLAVHKLRGGLDKDGNIVAWDQQIAVQSFMKGTAFEDFMIKDGIDESAVAGSKELPYGIPNLRIGQHLMENGVPTLWWRSVEHTHNAYANETFLDELIERSGKDPVETRLKLLGDKHPRHRGVLEKAAEIAGAAGSVPDGRARGVAVHKSFGSYVAQIAEVSEGANGEPRVHRIWCAVDCGVPVNPDVIRAQMEGGIGYGIGAVLYDAITLDHEGKVEQANFDRYRSLRINEMPEVEVAVIPSTEPPTGVGEPGTPPSGPAIANAWRRLTGKSVHRLPLVPFTA
ncbi:xanthine dehydrogenase family protein molybdopterin-binding subunit [Marinobacter nanhaiticus D15-8W]|uniref:Xanthine dehydrogenase family protein molybdopterin-binding subunit n=1 Tax=Marinobacter nanhaiticus D15-8W TaxID=626887 RepID=N6VXN0_9GAMM|nr:xanthine dehydrogenase family protein molybdopterin-binding subunit [Marinobacter nanhaiticus]ENO15030.1 xanthine dehydrogenase family protein molybdopterin-binding subunit [Marinobacter nanhaiticus D15-8W]BES69270.1 xanthine dehydrogenase family protein molybdopterin-binding subunit [Marinobacter nanhaiticus D15-8W]